MQQNLSNPSQPARKTGPVLEIIDGVVPPALFDPAWSVCSGKGWYFGHTSNGASSQGRFWKLDLDGDAAFNAIWEHVRPRCEAAAGVSLRVIRQYANGHTYGLGGSPHLDDNRPGTFTFLYYPNPEWKNEWDGETVFFDEGGEITFAVKPRPNRGVFFDSRIPHAGRAPSRACPGLRVTVAYKLEAAGTKSVVAPVAQIPTTPQPKTIPTSQPAEPVVAEEIRRDGALRVYRVRASAETIDQGVQESLAKKAASVRLPGFKAGKIPPEVMAERYGAQTRAAVLQSLSVEMLPRLLPKGSIASEIMLKSGAQSGDLEMEVHTTYLPDLPPADFSEVALERLTASDTALQAVGASPEEAVRHFRDRLKQQVLDRLDAAYRFPLMPGAIDRELAAIWRGAEQVKISPEEKEQTRNEFRSIAERRLRLGLVIGELARRNDIHGAQGSELEDQVIDHLVAQARVTERPATEEELRELAKA